MTVAVIEDVLQASQPVLLAVDQAPFVIRGEGGRDHTFCVLVPLMTADGRRFEDPARDFPNRGRVWWMVRGDLDIRGVEPGSLWTAELKPSGRGYDPDDPRKDRYQVDQDSIVAGAADWLEVLDVPAEVVDLQALASEPGLAFARPTLPDVILRARAELVGPLRAVWRAAQQCVMLCSSDPQRPAAFRAPADRLSLDDHIHEFRYTANQWAPEGPILETVLRLVHRKHVAVLEHEGEAVDISMDARVVARWAADLSEREQAIAAREVALRRRERDIGERLRRLIQDYGPRAHDPPGA